MTISMDQGDLSHLGPIDKLVNKDWYIWTLVQLVGYYYYYKAIE
jgi:hypothetical protein